ncbi:hypothetical protein STVIR_5444 [Streptomyces viridochromogenes Tue57]|uniref:Uncharacterized protein n=1 Tax=Streptomyces viridochromogenes Tue57 TaxID=1160705 RepID=L8PBH8_STRVR|nr:hypothetical protein STVIR_5444 [Streptomyces viridochromogenes Tue57]
MPLHGRRRRAFVGLSHREGRERRRGGRERDGGCRRSERPGSTGHLRSSPAFGRAEGRSWSWRAARA